MKPERAANADELTALELGLTGRAADSQQTLAHARACFPGGTDRQQRLLALHLATMFALDDALELAPPLPSALVEQQTLLPWLEPPRDLEAAETFGARAHIRRAIAQVEHRLASTMDSTPSDGSATQWWREQGELMVAAVWQEAVWRTGGELPDENSYLAVAETSIGIWWIVATLLLLDGITVAPRPQTPLIEATAAVAAAVRLANDLHETRRERREGKVQTLFLRTRALQNSGLTARAAERRARQELTAIIRQRAAIAWALLEDPNWSGPHGVRSGLLGMLSTALALIHLNEPAQTAQQARS